MVGRNDQIREVCDRFASGGSVALDADLSRGDLTTFLLWQRVVKFFREPMT